MAKENKENNKVEEVEKKALDKSMQEGYQAKGREGKMPTEVPESVKKEMEKTRAKLEKFKKSIIKKYPFTLSIGIIPPQAAEKFDEENELSEEEKKEKPMHLLIIIPEDKFKEINKIKLELMKESKDMKPRLWLNIMTPVDVWNLCLDGKYDISEAIGMAFPLYDKGILGALRVAQIHKSLVLRKFEKYVTSYIICGSLVRGDAKKTSDVDVFIVIDDTDVKRMPRLELKEKLRAIIYSYIMEAGELAGVKNKLNVQVYILTEFWESVKDAHPVMFTMIRDGVPLYDRGTFMPWKLILKMGKIKPSPEAIDMFMSMGDKLGESVKRKLLDIVMGDLYWGVLTPSQALLMLYGLPPPNTKETFKEMKRIFVDKEKILEKKYIDILETITIKYYKGYEHEKIKEVKGAEVDKLLKDAESYMKRLKELREQIEKRVQEKTIEQIHDNVFKILKGLFGKKSETQLVKAFERELVNKGKTDPRFLHVLNELIIAKKKYKSKKKPTKHEVEEVRKNAVQLINNLIEYGQRCELVDLQRSKVVLSYKNKKADLFLTNPAFLIQEGKIKKITDKIEDAGQNEFENIMGQQKGKAGKLTGKIISLLKKELGEFEVSI
jgi:predicted nucleotidyltransferase